MANGKPTYPRPIMPIIKSLLFLDDSYYLLIILNMYLEGIFKNSKIYKIKY